MDAMMLQEMLFGTLGGLCLFMFGMTLMSEGLKKSAGQGIRNVLETMTRRRLIGFLVGAVVTALIQSSSAATVMVVGFVNAGLMTLQQSIAVIIGTNVGTTATAWLVSLSGFESFKITAYALPIAALGYCLQTFARNRRAKDIGQILFGFGLLFIGISFMKDAFRGVENSDAVQALFVRAANVPLLAVLAGMCLTMLIQSSSAAVASVQLLAASGAFGTNWEMALSVAIPFVLGSNIGTTITAQLAAVRATRNAKRAAWAHTMFNVLGTFCFYWLIDWVAALVLHVSPWEMGAATIAASIAVAHSALKIMEAMIFLPLTGVLQRIVTLLIRDREGDAETRPVVLESNLLKTPVIAMQQARREIVRMAQTARKALSRAVDGMLEDDRKKLESVSAIEDFVDMFQFEITRYLSALSGQKLTERESNQLPVMLHVVNDLERVGDHAENIMEIACRKIDQRLTFSDDAMREAEDLRTRVMEMLGAVIHAVEHGDRKAAQRALAIEEEINEMQVKFRRSHVQRMTDGDCLPTTGLIFIDLVDNVEKIGDHLCNIAQAVVGGLQWEGHGA